MFHQLLLHNIVFVRSSCYHSRTRCRPPLNTTPQTEACPAHAVQLRPYVADTSILYPAACRLVQQRLTPYQVTQPFATQRRRVNKAGARPGAQLRHRTVRPAGARGKGGSEGQEPRQLRWGRSRCSGPRAGGSAPMKSSRAGLGSLRPLAPPGDGAAVAKPGLPGRTGGCRAGSALRLRGGGLRPPPTPTATPPACPSSAPPAAAPAALLARPGTGPPLADPPLLRPGPPCPGRHATSPGPPPAPLALPRCPPSRAEPGRRHPAALLLHLTCRSEAPPGGLA